MQGANAVEIFELARQGNNLPGKMEDLVPLSFIGQSAVSFFRQRLKLMDKLNMTEKQRQATLKDGQDAGGLLLDIESRIGEICLKEKDAEPKYKSNGYKKIINRPSGRAPKHERLGLPEKRMTHAQTIAKNPKIVAEVKAKAIENEDIPSKAAVINEVRYRKEKKRRKEAEGKREEIKAIVAIEQVQYVSKLDRIISILPQKPPEKWDERMLREASVKANIIIKRLEVFKNE